MTGAPGISLWQRLHQTSPINQAHITWRTYTRNFNHTQACPNTPEGPSYRTVIPRPTVKWEYSALTTEKGQQDMMPTMWAGTGTEPDRNGHTPIWQPSCGNRPTSPEPRADNIHSLRPAEPERRCVKASILHMESPSHWREDQNLTSGNTTPSYTRPTRQATSRANLNGVKRRTRVSNVCQVPKPVVTRIRRNSGEVCTVKNNFKLNKSRQVDKLWIWIKLQRQKPRLILALGWRWENSQVPDGM